MKAAALAILLVFSIGCVHRSFRVLPADPDYLLRSPEAREVPFHELLSRYNGFVPGKDWLDLRPRMEVRVENAYYQQGVPKRGLNGYLNTEVAQYQVRPDGSLHLLNVRSMPRRPADQPPVEELLTASRQQQPYYRFFYEVLFKGAARGSVLLGAASSRELDRLTTQLQATPEAVCDGRSLHCTVFPEACSVSLEMEIAVNGAARTVAWKSTLASIAPHPRKLALRRLYAGHPTLVHINPADPKALRLPLLPGDNIIWN